MIVLDTNVTSELMRPSSLEVDEWLEAQPAGTLYSTAVTLAEIRDGLTRLPVGRRRTELTELANDVFRTFAERILPFDTAPAIHYARIVNDRRQAGRPVSYPDAQIAAICHTHGAALATRNVKDFDGTGIEVIDPWA